jgi:hypothetical protein
LFFFFVESEIVEIPSGPVGEKGPRGDKGPDGDKGEKGNASYGGKSTLRVSHAFKVMKKHI